MTAPLTTLPHPDLASEKQWQAQVIDLAHLYGWTVAHFRPAMTKHGWRTPVAADGAGFPDLVMVRGKRLIFAELKSKSGKLHARQRVWLGLLAAVPCIDVFVWKPGDFDEVQGALSHGTRS